MNEQPISAVDAAQATFQAAYAYHEYTYKLLHPPPKLQMDRIDRSDLVIVVGLVVMVLASVIVSGSRTIVEFGGNLIGPVGLVVGVAAFVMLEVTIVAYAFFITRRTQKRNERRETRLAHIGLWTAMFVTVVANLHATLKGNGVHMEQAVDIFILLVVAVSAPILAFTSGHLLGSEAVALADRKQKAVAAFDEAMIEWNAGLLRSWHVQKRQMNVRVDFAPPEPPPALSTPVNDTSVTGVDTLTPAQQMIWDRLVDDPSLTSLTVRALADKVGSNRQTVSDVLKIYRRKNGQGDDS